MNASVEILNILLMEETSEKVGIYTKLTLSGNFLADLSSLELAWLVQLTLKKNGKRINLELKSLEEKLRYREEFKNLSTRNLMSLSMDCLDDDVKAIWIGIESYPSMATMKLWPELGYA